MLPPLRIESLPARRGAPGGLSLRGAFRNRITCSEEVTLIVVKDTEPGRDRPASRSSNRVRIRPRSTAASAVLLQGRQERRAKVSWGSSPEVVQGARMRGALWCAARHRIDSRTTDMER